MLHCAFGKFATFGCYPAKYPEGTPLYGRMAYFRNGNTEVLLAAFDFLGTFPREAKRFCKEVSERTGIPAENIWYHELQIHAAPDGNDLAGVHMDALIARAVEIGLSLRQSAQPCTCEASEVDCGTRYSFNREQYVAGLGGVTVWSGMSFDDQGRPFTQDPSIMLLRGYEPKLPVFEKPIYFDNPNDPKAYLFVFRGADGKPVGTISRFAAHPDVAVLFELRGVQDQYRFDYDWPGYLSDALERRFAAPSLYLNGPCADLTTKKGFDGMDTFEDCDGEARRIGEELAKVLADGYDRRHTPVSETLRAARFTVDLPMRETMPADHAALAKQPKKIASAEKAFREAIASDAPAYRVKQLCDDWWRELVARAIVEDICGFDDAELRARSVEVDVMLLKLGEYLFVGVPGESLTDMSAWLRSTFTGSKTIPVDQVNGYYDYMATPMSLTHGGYTYWSSWVTADSIPRLKEAMRHHIPAFLEEEQ